MTIKLTEECKNRRILQSMVGSEGILDLEAIARLLPESDYHKDDIYLLACKLLWNGIDSVKQKILDENSSKEVSKEEIDNNSIPIIKTTSELKREIEKNRDLIDKVIGPDPVKFSTNIKKEITGD
jgi:hypothetical protein